MISVGQTVSHKVFGNGEVVRRRRGGYDLLVRFSDGLDRWAVHHDLTVIKDAQNGSKTSISQESPGSDERLSSASVVHQARPQGAPNLVDLNRLRSPAKQLDTTETPGSLDTPLKDSHICRRMIEAFRLGIVPTDCLTQFTFGRELQIQLFDQWLHSKDTNNLFLFGTYGSGKTHLQNYLAQVLLANGYATATVIIDHQESPLYKPKRVFSEIVKSFRFPIDGSRVGGFREFVQSSLLKGGLRDHLHFSQMADCENELQWSWIECRESYTRPMAWESYEYGSRLNRFTHLPSLPDFGTATNVYCYLISGLGHAAIHQQNLRGLAVFFDEAESVDLNRGANFLKALTRTANNDPRLTDPEALWTTGLTFGLNYRSIPFIYRRPTGLNLVFAFTDQHSLERISSIGEFLKLDLDPISQSAIREMQERLCRVYGVAYGDGALAIDSSVVQRLLREFNANHSDSTRMSVKAVVEFLDFRRFRGPS